MKRAQAATQSPGMFPNQRPRSRRIGQPAGGSMEPRRRRAFLGIQP